MEAMAPLLYMIGECPENMSWLAFTQSRAIQASSEVFQNGTVAERWDDEATHAVGSAPKGVAIYEGSSPQSGLVQLRRLTDPTSLAIATMVDARLTPVIDVDLCLWDLSSFMPDLGSPDLSLERCSRIDSTVPDDFNHTLGDLLFPRGPRTWTTQDLYLTMASSQ